MRRIAPPDRQRIIAQLEQCAADRESLANQVIMLAIRVGDHLVIFDIERGETPTMVVLRVRHTREAYD